MPYISNRKAVSGREGPSISSSEVLEAKMTDPYQRPTVSYYDASQQQPTAEQGTYAPVPAAYHPGPPTPYSSSSGEPLYAPVPYYNPSQQPSAEQGKYSPVPATLHPNPLTAHGISSGEPPYAPVPPSYTEQASDPTPTEPATKPAPAEKPEDDQPSKKIPKPLVDDAIAFTIISLAIMAAIMYGLAVGACKAVDHIRGDTHSVKAPSPTTATQQFQPASGVRLMRLYGPSSTVVSCVDFGPYGTGLEGREEK
jgi:hypothetical protein